MRAPSDDQLSFDISPGRRRTTKRDVCLSARCVGLSCRVSVSFCLYRDSMRANSRGAETRVHVSRESEIASAVDHAGEAGQATVTKHRKSRRKRSKNAAGDTKVRFLHGFHGASF